MNYFKSGLHNKKLLQVYSYDKKKKELLDGQKENNTQERPREEKEKGKAATKL